jgi:uncharacterized protein YqfA (UPF0365 family)
LLQFEKFPLVVARAAAMKTSLFALVVLQLREVVEKRSLVPLLLTVFLIRETGAFLFSTPYSEFDAKL